MEVYSSHKYIESFILVPNQTNTTQFINGSLPLINFIYLVIYVTDNFLSPNV